jgi:putative hemolysin
MPVYKEDLDHVTGILVAKDLMPCVIQGDFDTEIRPFIRRPGFVPQTMTVQDFVKYSQRMRMHQAVVVDEFGGTEGIVTLEDAIGEVVGDIGRDETQKLGIARLAQGLYRVDGGLSLDDLNEIVGVQIEDEEHETVAGFLMDQTNKIPEVGDHLEHKGIRFTVQDVEGKRAATVQIQILAEAKQVEKL